MVTELAWRLMEFWKDRVVEPMAVIGKVLDPIIENAIKKKGEKRASSADDNTDGETLLSHLVKLTDGEHRFRLFFLRTLRLPRSQDYSRRNNQHHDCWEGYCAFNPPHGLEYR